VAHEGADFKECFRHCRDVTDPAKRHHRKRQEFQDEQD
jgi:hypothetical protein